MSPPKTESAEKTGSTERTGATERTESAERTESTGDRVRLNQTFESHVPTDG